MDEARIWNRFAEGYAKRPVADEAAYQKKLEVTRGYFRPDMEVLEFGCGTGSTAIAHAPHVKRIRAIDFSSKMIEIAERKAVEAKIENVVFARSSIDEFPDEQAFDAVLGLSVLHLLEDKEAVIAKVFRMLLPGGIFVSSTVCMGDKLKFFKWIAPIGKFFSLLPLLKVFPRSELEASIRSAGFEIDHVWQPGGRAAVFIVAKKPG